MSNALNLLSSFYHKISKTGIKSRPRLLKTAPNVGLSGPKTMAKPFPHNSQSTVKNIENLVFDPQIRNNSPEWLRDKK